MFTEFIGMFLQVLQNPSSYTFNLELPYLSDYILNQIWRLDFSGLILLILFPALLYLSIFIGDNIKIHKQKMYAFMWIPLFFTISYILFCICLPSLVNTYLCSLFMVISALFCFMKNFFYLRNNRVLSSGENISFFKEQNRFLHPYLYLNTFFMVLDLVIIHLLYININNSNSTKLITNLLIMNQNHGWPYLTQSFYGSLLYIIFYGVYAQVISFLNAIFVHLFTTWPIYLKKILNKSQLSPQ